jgi:hypothetical protein
MFNIVIVMYVLLCVLCVLFVCKCELYCCHRVSYIYIIFVTKTLLHVSMPQCIIFREFFCYTKVTCQLKYSSLVYTVKSVKRISLPGNNIQSILHIVFFSPL